MRRSALRNFLPAETDLCLILEPEIGLEPMTYSLQIELLYHLSYSGIYYLFIEPYTFVSSDCIADISGCVALRLPLKSESVFTNSPGGLARSGINLWMIAQAPYEVCKKAFNRTLRQSARMYTIMPDATNEVTYLVAQKLGKVHVFRDEHNSFNGSVSTSLVAAHTGVSHVVSRSVRVRRSRREGGSEARMRIRCNIRQLAGRGEWIA